MARNIKEYVLSGIAIPLKHEVGWIVLIKNNAVVIVTDDFKKRIR